MLDHDFQRGLLERLEAPAAQLGLHGLPRYQHRFAALEVELDPSLDGADTGVEFFRLGSQTFLLRQRRLVLRMGLTGQRGLGAPKTVAGEDFPCMCGALARLAAG